MAIDMSITSLKNKITAAGGLQRSNRFYVKIDGPVAPFNVEPNDNETPTQYIAETVLLPVVTMTTQSDGLAGPGLGRTVPRGLFYKDGILMTFPVFGNWELVKGLDNWLRYMYGQPTSSNVWVTQYYKSSDIAPVFGQVQVTALDLTGTTKAIYTFNEAYPIEIAPIQFSSLESNKTLSIQVRFLFREYTLT